MSRRRAEGWNGHPPVSHPPCPKCGTLMKVMFSIEERGTMSVWFECPDVECKGRPQRRRWPLSGRTTRSAMGSTSVEVH